MYVSTNKSAIRFAKKHGLKFGAARFVAGTTIDSVVRVTKELNNRGFIATVDCLGEFVANDQEAIQAAEHCVETLEAIHDSQLKSGLSVKLTQLGLDISEELCLNNMRKILDTAQKHGIFVQIDMEDYARNEVTLKLFKQLRQEYGDTVGTVIQSYLYKSLNDVTDLASCKATLRIVKGAYKESPEVAYPNKKDVDENYLQLVKAHLLNGCYVGIATHDSKMVRDVVAFIKSNNIPKEQYEFQMLYGIGTDLQNRLIKEGYKVRLYIPYGDDWFGYFMRRLAERPANVWFVLKNLLK